MNFADEELCGEEGKSSLGATCEKKKLTDRMVPAAERSACNDAIVSSATEVEERGEAHRLPTR